LDPKVKRSIDVLPFTDKGYAKAKEMLVEKYANESEIVNSYVEEIISLPTINGSQPGKIHSFFEKLRYNVQSLETLNKLSGVNGYVRMTINKLPSIPENWYELTRNGRTGRLFNYAKLYEIGLKETQSKTTNQKINEEIDMPKHSTRTQQKKNPTKPRACVYCDSMEHKSTTCSVVSTPLDRKTIRNYAIIVLGGHIALLNVEVPPRVRTVVKDTIRRSAILKQN
jgi:multimeric flavodoxin WrbA